MNKDLPRLLLVSEASLDRERTGLNRTLVNLLAEYPADRFMVYVPQSTLKSHPTAPPLNQNIAAFSEGFLPYLNNRLGLLLNPVFQVINFQLLEWMLPAERDKIAAFAPEIILICPVNTLGLLMGYKVAQSFRCPFIIYFMDDWLDNHHQRWLTGGVQTLSRTVLEKASGWLMISSQLEKDLMQRYKIFPKRSLIVHNPVDLSQKTPPDLKNRSDSTFRVVYAGAIWTMHYDAIASVAEAIHELKSSGLDIELVLYTAPNCWDLHQKHWEAWEVKYGSLIPYEELNQYLQQADLLLVASSFIPKYAQFTRSSVQTKLTDYMASGRAIFACGPRYSACNQFVKVWKCGLVCETNKLAKIKGVLLEQIKNPDRLEILGKNAFACVQEHFEAGRVRSNLYKFIQENKYVNLQR